MSISNMPVIGGLLKPITALLDGLKPTMTRFKDDLTATLQQQGMAPEEIERLREVLDSGKDEDMTDKLDQLARGELMGKDGRPIDLGPAQIDRDMISQLAQKNGVKADRLDPSRIGADPWESYPTTAGATPDANWLAG